MGEASGWAVEAHVQIVLSLFLFFFFTPYNFHQNFRNQTVLNFLQLNEFGLALQQRLFQKLWFLLYLFSPILPIFTSYNDANFAELACFVPESPQFNKKNLTCNSIIPYVIELTCSN